MVTIWDVAARAGVSKSTVSLVINDSPLVAENTRKRVQAAIKALNYVPNYNARRLQKKNNNSIGIIHTLRIDHNLKKEHEWNYGLEQFSHDVEDGIFEGIIEQGSNLGVFKEQFSIAEDGMTIPKIIEDRRVDGAIFIGGFDNSQVMKTVLGNISIPVVIVTASLTIDGVDTVSHDPEQGCYLAARKLIETGHKRICLMNTPRSFRIWQKRPDGVIRAAIECDYDWNTDLLLFPEKNTAESGYIELSKLLDRGIVPDAVIAADNEMAMGVLRCLHEYHLRVPEDVSIIVYDDSAICGNITPALSAVNIHKELIGRTALSFLLERIENPDAPAKEITVEPHLVMRSSVLDRRF